MLFTMGGKIIIYSAQLKGNAFQRKNHIILFCMPIVPFLFRLLQLLKEALFHFTSQTPTHVREWMNRKRVGGLVLMLCNGITEFKGLYCDD